MDIVTESRITFDIEQMAAFEARALEIAATLDRGDAIEPQAHISFPDIKELLNCQNHKGAGDGSTSPM